MSTRRRLLGVAAAAAGTLVAGGTAAALAQRRAVRKRRRASSGRDDFGTLRSDPVQVTTSDGIHLHAEVDEPDAAPGGPTIVFVHGYALNLDCWHFQRDHFRGDHRLVFYDQRSHGRSDRSPVGNATIDQLGRDLRSVLDQLAPEGPVILVGHSMGGMTIMSLADHHPELFGDRVVGVGLVSTTAGGLKTHRVIGGSYLPDRLMRELTPRAMALLARAPGLVDGARRSGSDLGFFITGKMAFGSEEVPTTYIEFVDEMLMQTPFEVIAEFFPNFDTLDKFSVLHAFEKVPTTIICGTEDVLTSIGHSRKMASRLKSAQLLEIPRSGHMVILERSEQVNTALGRLVAEAAAKDVA
ncbi:MAG TPA: alpha/beta hydrolase [Nocardioidaceae bacterium]|nr:alpha/beta hydrolase [Nocardioidaceae bacterium]